MACTLVCPVTLPCRHNNHLPHPPCCKLRPGHARAVNTPVGLQTRRLLTCHLAR
jgi:hypothetical protein